MKCNRIIAWMLLIAVIIATFATGCSDLLQDIHIGAPVNTEEARESGSEEKDSEFEYESGTEPQDMGTGSPSDAHPTVQSPEVVSTAGPLDTAQTQEPETTTELPEPSAAGQTTEPTVTWPVVSPTPTIPVAPVIPIESITLSASDITIDRRSEYKIGHTVFPEDATDKTVSYISSNRAVATVTNDGVIYAAGAGSAVIQCVSASGKISASCSVTVVVPVTNLSISVKRSTYKIDESFSFSVNVFPNDATDKTYTVSIDNTDLADLSDNTVFCISSGSLTITAIASNGVTTSKEITVVDLAELAYEVFRLTNEQRQIHGLDSFSQDVALTQTAALRARESKIFFSHTRPDGSDCFSAFDENGVIYGMAAENIAYGQKTPTEVVAGWMDSPGHRANILNPGLINLGAAVEMDENGRLYWSQEFTD